MKMNDAKVMTNWRPDPATLIRPAYLSLAEQIARAIADGDLAEGARLPPHRRMADDLGLSVQTVSRAYEELTRRGLIAGEVGRGSFVRAARAERDPPYLPERLGEVIDLSILKPVSDLFHLEKMREALRCLAETLPPSSVLSFRPNVVFPRHRSIAADWLRRCGLDVPAHNIILTNGASPAIAAALMSTAPPGAAIAAESMSHHMLVPLAGYLGITPHAVAGDDEGMLPGALDALCRAGGIRAVFLQPTVVNPQTALMGADRRAELAEVARRHDLALIENDVLGPLVADRPPPLAAIAPERTLHIASFTKVAVPGLRFGYLAVPDRFAAAAANRHLAINWIANPTMAEIAARWIGDGTVEAFIAWQRDALARRHAIAAAALADIPFRAHPQSLHLWLPLRPGQNEDMFVSQARQRGVAIAPGTAFRIGEGPWPQAVRISVGSTSESELRAGLGAIASLMLADPEELMLSI